MSVVRNAVAAGQYLKHLSLRAPVFQEDGPRVAPPTRIDRNVRALLLPDGANGVEHARTADLSVRLATLLQACAAPARWEPMNTTPIHRGIPSPRTLFPCELVLSDESRPERSAWRYLPDYHALIPSNDRAPAAAERVTTIAIVADVTRIAAYYGEFCTHLAALEAGHLGATVALLANALGWDCELDDTFASTRHWQHYTNDSWTRMPLALVRVAGDGISLGGLPVQALRVCEFEAPAEYREVYPHLASLVQAARSDGWETSRPAFEPRPVVVNERVAKRDLLDVVRRRSSGHDGQGYVPRGERFDDATFESLLGYWTVFARQNCFARAADVGVTPYITRLAATPGQERMYRFDTLAGQCEQIESAALGPAYAATTGVGYGYNFAEYSIILGFRCNFAELLDRFGDRGFSVAHAQAGRLAQQFCLSASAHGMFARPIRAYAEHQLEDALGVDEQIIYQVLCGFDRIHSLTFRWE